MKPRYFCVLQLCSGIWNGTTDWITIQQCPGMRPVLLLFLDACGVCHPTKTGCGSVPRTATKTRNVMVWRTHPYQTIVGPGWGSVDDIRCNYYWESSYFSWISIMRCCKCQRSAPTFELSTEVFVRPQVDIGPDMCICSCCQVRRIGLPFMVAQQLPSNRFNFVVDTFKLGVSGYLSYHRCLAAPTILPSSCICSLCIF